MYEDRICPVLIVLLSRELPVDQTIGRIKTKKKRDGTEPTTRRGCVRPSVAKKEEKIDGVDGWQLLISGGVLTSTGRGRLVTIIIIIMWVQVALSMPLAMRLPRTTAQSDHSRGG